ncbi:CRAL-TRIO domain-containing protein [Polychytrium aggregatum]|uniref:CRAL-TRIO domain-containing protein n=1 Tax=Polychytrium aggregatum TaxID=110093 RepID=UPI0022FDBAB2|nr:CRAL-TRIO domain-containing protein [Polychytrium aggregatum]KAI9199840.1 CRAL-TRIO domain-containing protein [Polychytrium aggregatum]
MPLVKSIFQPAPKKNDESSSEFNLATGSSFHLNANDDDNDDDDSTTNGEVDAFISTARELFKDDGVDELDDQELKKWFAIHKRHRGKALSALSQTLTWRKKEGLAGIVGEDFGSHIQSGKCQWIGESREGTPVLIWIESRHEPPKGTAAKDRDTRFFLYLIEMARRSRIMTDKITIIVDRTQITSSRTDAFMLTNLIPLLTHHYPDSLLRVLLFPTGLTFWIMWNMARMFMDAATVQKVVTFDDPKRLYEFIDTPFLLEKYGGKMKDPHEHSLKPMHDHKEGQTEGEGQKAVKVEEVWQAPDSTEDLNLIPPKQ